MTERCFWQSYLTELNGRKSKIEEKKTEKISKKEDPF